MVCLWQTFCAFQQEVPNVLLNARPGRIETCSQRVHNVLKNLKTCSQHARNVLRFRCNHGVFSLGCRILLDSFGESCLLGALSYCSTTYRWRLSCIRLCIVLDFSDILRAWSRHPSKQDTATYCLRHAFWICFQIGFVFIRIHNCLETPS